MKKFVFLVCVLAAFISCKKATEKPLVDESKRGLIVDHGMVVSARAEASKIGASILEKGGNAFDAMVATELALNVAYPYAGSIGGGGFMVYRLSTGEVGSLDYREKAPLAASRDMYLDENGEVIGEVFTPICTSLNEVINENGDELSSLLQDDTFDIDTNFLTDNRIKNELTNVLSQLDDREREIIECYFGIDKDFNSMTLDTIGEKYNLSKERVRQIKERAIRKLRHNSEKLFNIIEEEDIY